MKNIKLLLLNLFLFTAVALQAQPPHAREKVEAMKIGFLTERLELSPEEAQVFWPVYNQYQDELEKVRLTRKDYISAARKGMDDLSDKEIEKLVDSELAFRQSELDLQKKYHGQFKKVLPIKKVAKLYRAEEDFKRKLLEMIQDRRDENREKGGRRPPERN